MAILQQNENNLNMMKQHIMCQYPGVEQF